MLRSADRLYEEVAFLALHLGWSYERLMEMDHFERERWILETLKLTQGEGRESYE
ncbi:MAG: hypothetical protein FWG06_00195 [Clostridiales bacterium]|nr:hypothetical protein [Clostridiales bacterium]